MCDYFELYREAGRYGWRLKKEGATDPIAIAVRNHATKTEAINDVALARRLAPNAAASESFRESSRRFRWRLKNEAGVSIAISAGYFSTDARAVNDKAQMMGIVPTAVLRDRTETHPIYYLGTLPSELTLPPELAIKYPAAPTITNTRVITASEPLDRPNTGYQIRANLPQINISASDVEVRVEAGFQVGTASIGRGVKRVNFMGGTYQKIVFSPPFGPDNQVNEAWVIENILFDGVNVDSYKYYAKDDHDDANAFSVRGRRVAIVRCNVRSRDYCVYAGDGPFTTADLILAGNKFEGICGQATVRLYPVERAVVVENCLSSVTHHNYRVHGPSRLVYAARNVFINGGVMLIDPDMHTIATHDWQLDNHDRLWLVDNVFRQKLSSLLELQRRGKEIREMNEWLKNFIFTGNYVTSTRDIHSEQLSNIEAHRPETWVVQNNSFEIVRIS